MIAYDLDGVFLPDLNITDNLDELLTIRTENLIPIFQPKGDFVIITGRPVEDKKFTMKWIKQNFKNPPKKVYHENTDIDSGCVYKRAVLKEHPEITTFIESDRDQVLYLTKTTDTEIIYFNDFINKAMQYFKTKETI